VILYDEKISNKLRTVFYQDLHDAEKIDAKKWNLRPARKQLPEKLARLFSPVM
jgi:cardiolipin synthase